MRAAGNIHYCQVAHFFTREGKYNSSTMHSLHGEEGPAAERANGTKEWWRDGKKLTAREMGTLQAKLAVFPFIEGWYNPHRRHSSIGYLSPVNYEQRLKPAA